MGTRHYEIVALAEEWVQYGDDYAPSADEMDMFFREALGIPYAQADYHTQKNWCGIWAAFILRRVGLPVKWGPIPYGWGVTGPRSVIIPNPTNSPSGAVPGDIGVYSPADSPGWSHHFIIVDIVEEYDYLETLNGNGPWGHIARGRGSISGSMNWYYRIVD